MTQSLSFVGPKFKPVKYTFNAENFYVQFVLVYLQPLQRNLLLKRASQPKTAKNH